MWPGHACWGVGMWCPGMLQEVQMGKVQNQEVLLMLVWSRLQELHVLPGYSTAPSRQPCPTAMKELFLASTLSNYHVFFPLPFSCKSQTWLFGLFSFHIWETSCFVVTVGKKLHRKNADTFQMAQLRSIQCHCWAHSIRKCRDRTPQANWLGCVTTGRDCWLSLYACPEGWKLPAECSLRERSYPIISSAYLTFKASGF